MEADVDDASEALPTDEMLKMRKIILMFGTSWLFFKESALLKSEMVAACTQRKL
jgi:hypothetical protein